jgi:predicted ATPase
MIVTNKNNFFVFTGGPGAGKSTLLNALSAYRLPHVSETARAIIKERLEKKLSPRPAAAEFAKQIFKTDHWKYLENIWRSDILLFDRSFLDSSFMLQESDDAYFEEIKDVMQTLRFNKMVFIAPPWEEIYEKDAERDQTFKEAQDIYEKLFDWYSFNHYHLIDLPKVPIADRVRFVLLTIETAGISSVR